MAESRPGCWIHRRATRPQVDAGAAGSRPQYAVAPDGRFLMNVVVEAPTVPPIAVVLNWGAGLKK